MVISDEVLREYETGESDPRTAQVQAMARELRAARKVVRAARAWGNASTYAAQTRGETRIFDSLVAYDKARKGKVAT